MACLFTAPAAPPEPASAIEQPPVPLAHIIDRMMAREKVQESSLRSYISHRHYRIHNVRFNKTAEMAVRLTYANPGGKSFDVLHEAGPAPIRKQALRRMLQSEVEASHGKSSEEDSAEITPANYDFRFLRVDRDRERPAYVLEAAPKRDSKYLLRGSIWVDIEDFGITRIEGRPAKRPSFWIRDSLIVYQFEKVGDFWLPKSTQSEAQVRIFGTTNLDIQYGQYEINRQ